MRPPRHTVSYVGFDQSEHTIIFVSQSKPSITITNRRTREETLPNFIPGRTPVITLMFCRSLGTPSPLFSKIKVSGTSFQ